MSNYIILLLSYTIGIHVAMTVTVMYSCCDPISYTNKLKKLVNYFMIILNSRASGTVRTPSTSMGATSRLDSVFCKTAQRIRTAVYAYQCSMARAEKAGQNVTVDHDRSASNC